MELKDKLKQPFCFSSFSRKGGVSKSVTSLSLAWTYANIYGFRTLLVDCDPQGSSTNCLGYNRNYESVPELSMKNVSAVSKKLKEERFLSDNEGAYVVDDLFGNPKELELSSSQYTGLHDLLMCVINSEPLDKKTIQDAIVTPKYKVELPKGDGSNLTLGDLSNPQFRYEEFGFDLLPSSEELADDEMYMMTTNDVKDKAYVLKKVISAIKKHDMYDIIILDCGPSLSFMSLNAISSSDGTVMCSNLDQQSIFSICKTKKNFRDIKRYDKDQTGILGVLIGMDDPRAVIRPIIIDRIKNLLNLYVFKTTIPRSANAPKAMTIGMTFPQIDGKARIAFSNLAEEIIDRYNTVKAWDKKTKTIVDKRKDELMNNKKVMGDINKKVNEDIDMFLNENGRTREDVSEKIISDIEKLYTDNRLMEMLRNEYDKGELYEYMTSEYKEDSNE